MINCKSKFYSDKEIAIMRVAHDGAALENLKDYSADKDVVIAAVENQPNAFQFASKELRDDEDVLKAALTSNNFKGYELDFFKSASDRLKGNREIVLLAVKNEGWILEHVSEELKADKEVVLAALNHWNATSVLQFASDELRADREVALEGWLSFASKELRADKDFVIEVVGKHGNMLEAAPDKFRDDKDVVLAAVSADNDECLKYASDRLKKDKEVVLAAVKRLPTSLRHADNKLKQDRDIVIATVKNYGWMLRELPKKLQNDKDIVLAAIEKDGMALEYASDKLKGDKDVVLKAVLKRTDALDFASDELKADLALKNLKRGLWD